MLVVEDESTVRDLVSRVLRGQGYEVMESERGADALGICGKRAGAIDLVVTDFVMPGGMNGRDLAAPPLARRVRELLDAERA